MMDKQVTHRLSARWQMLHGHRAWILLASFLCASAALIVSLLMPSIYRATTFLLVSDSKIGESVRDTNLQQMAMLPTFVPFVDNDALIEQSLQTLKLNQPPYNLTVDMFRRKDYLDVRAPKSTRLLEVSVEFPDARLSADLANTIAQGAVRYNEKLNATDTVATQEFLRKQFDRALEAQGQAANARLRAFEEARIEDREKELAILLTEKERLSAQLQQLRLDLVQNQSRSRLLEQSLANEPEIIALKRSVTSNRFVELAATKTFPEDTPLVVTEESINKVREDMKQTLVSASVSGAAQSAGIEAASTRLAQVNRETTELSGRIATFRARIEAAVQSYALAVETTKNASREYQAASVTVSSKSQDIKQISPALVPQRPVRPRILLNTLMGFLLGFLFSVGYALAVQTYREALAQKAFEGEEVRLAEAVGTRRH